MLSLDFFNMESQIKFQCNYCQLIFSSLGNKMRHVRTRQFSQRPTCLWCANRSADTKEKPYVCECKASFTRSDALLRHKRLLRKDCSNRLPYTSVPVAESLRVDSRKDPSQQPLGGNGTDPRLDSIPHSIDQMYQFEPLRLSSENSGWDESPKTQRTWNDSIDLPEEMDLDTRGYISSSNPSQTSFVLWNVDPFPCSSDDKRSCYPVPPSPGTVHGNPSRLSAPPRDFCPLPASGIIPTRACAQSPPASHFTIPKDQKPAPVAPTTDLALDQPWGNADGDDPLGYQPEQAVPIGGDLSPMPED